MSASDALAAVKTLYDVANKVKDNKDELLRLSRRIEHIVVTLDESRNRDIIRSHEYNDALSAIFDFITRSQRLAQRLLKRNLGDRTWNTGEISSELRRLNDDVQNYLSVHTVRALDLIHSSNVEHHSVLANNMEETMVKVAELDYFIRSRTGNGWAPSIESQAQTNFDKCINETERSLVDPQRISPLAPFSSLIKKQSSSRPLPSLPFSAYPRSSNLKYKPTSERKIGVDLEGLIQSGNFALKVVGLRKDSNDNSLSTLDLPLQADVTLAEIMVEIEDAGFKPPSRLYEEPELRISVTEGDSVYDATIPGGLKINQSEPLLWWWNKYATYHGLTFATTPSQTIAELQRSPSGVQVVAGGACFIFHRTLRVPDGGISNLPASLGTLPLISVDSNCQRIPPAVRERSGFLMPVFRREAIWLQFNSPAQAKGPAVKISVGGVNALSGVSTRSIEPPKFGAEQDYVVVGQQPWLYGIASGPGVVRQFVASDFGSGYTVEEQVTGKAEIGGFQFDIFPLRPDVDGKFFWEGRQVDSMSSPSELGIVGDQLVLERPRESTKLDRSSIKLSRQAYFRNSLESRFRIRNDSYEWSLSEYKRRVSSTATIKASYELNNLVYHRFRPQPFQPLAINENRPDFLGLAAGGQIVQKIYRDTNSPRIYDQENGRRFYVHIVTPEMWETITGVLPPITPITREMYIRNGVNWYKLFDDYMDSITVESEAISNVLSVTQLDEQNSVSSTRSQLPDLIDPYTPPDCCIHPNERSSCVFRPCGHVACLNCLGSAVLAGSKCPKCWAKIENFVGMLTPIPAISQNTRNTDQKRDWTVEETERLAATAASSDSVIVIHPLEDRPSPLYSSMRREMLEIGDS